MNNDVDLLALDTHIEELNELLDAYDIMPKLRSGLNGMLAWDKLRQDEKALVKDFFGTGTYSGRALYNSLYLSSVASFEAFLYASLASLLRRINAKGQPFIDLPPSFRSKYLVLCGKVLATLHNPPAHMSIDYLLVCKNLSTTDDPARVVLNPEVVAYVHNILDLTNYFDFIKSLGATLDYDGISKAPQVEVEFGAGGTRDRAKDIESFLDGMIVERNRIAHTGMSSSDIGREQIREHCKKVQCIARYLSSQVFALYQ